MTPPELAFKAIKEYLSTSRIISPPSDLPSALQDQAGVFVSIHDVHGDLRGCIGTFQPTQENIAAEIIENAIAAATRDFRFSPIELSDLTNLRCHVDILTKPELTNDLSSLDPVKYGILIEGQDGRKGLLLPDLEGVDTTNQQIAICRRKASIGPNDPIKIYKFCVKRYT